jgi:AraC-like DNA-binding protein
VRTVYLLSSPALRSFSILPAPFEVKLVGSAGKLRDLLSTASPSSVALVPFDAGCSIECIRAIVTTARLVPVIGAVPLTGTHAEHVRQLWRAGVSDVVDLEPCPSPELLAADLELVHACRFKQRFEADLFPHLSQNGLTLIRAAAEEVVDRGNSADLARRVDARERTLLHWCMREGLPTPRRLLVWIRVALAVALLETPERSIVVAARDAGYSSDHPFRRVLRDLFGEAFGTSPRALTFSVMMESFNSELRSRRVAMPVRKR